MRKKIEPKWVLIILSVIVPLAGWGLLVLVRPHLVSLSCLQSPLLCEKPVLYPGDQMSVGLNVAHADEISLWAQNLSGVFAFAIPLLILLLRVRRFDGAFLCRTFWDDWIFLGQTVAWNGVAVEIVRIIVQRPRPFVYEDPARLGANPWHYNSFVSGHASFSAAMGIAVLLLLVKHRANYWALLASGLVAESLVFTTGVCRILSGRHFISDVIAAFVVGSVAAAGTYKLRQRWGLTMAGGDQSVGTAQEHL